MMTEKEAWLYISNLWMNEIKLFKNGIYKEYYVFPTEFRQKSWGLCGCIDKLYFNAQKITHSVLMSMKNKIESHPKYEGGYIWNLNKKGTLRRAAFCRKMAKRCES